MQIDPTKNNVTRINSGQGPSDAGKASSQRPGNNSAKATSSASASTLRGVDTSDSSKDVNTARVDQIRQGIADGTLVFHANRIADGILATAREMAGNDSSS
ncbi:MAG: flagellar biosynthesis anti-sigma factor FlgM [Salinisphaera sp.]|nr:flagellar biosynthesis anti-sigma factor FlgM [Salinisphaera sp.]